MCLQLPNAYLQLSPLLSTPDLDHPKFKVILNFAHSIKKMAAPLFDFLRWSLWGHLWFCFLSLCPQPSSKASKVLSALSSKTYLELNFLTTSTSVTLAQATSVPWGTALASRLCSLVPPWPPPTSSWHRNHKHQCEIPVSSTLSTSITLSCSEQGPRSLLMLTRSRTLWFLGLWLFSPFLTHPMYMACFLFCSLLISICSSKSKASMPSLSLPSPTQLTVH